MSINTKTNLLTVGSVDGDVGVYDIRSPNNVVWHVPPTRS